MPAFEPSTIFHSRLAAFHSLLQEPGFRPPWLEFLERLPVVLGDSDSSRHVVFCTSDRLQQLLERSVAGLLELLARRADPDFDEERRRVLLPDERLRIVLLPKRFCPRSLPEDSPLRALLVQALLRNPALDGGLLESWLTPAGGGQSLYHTVKRLMVGALETTLRHPTQNGLLMLVFYALLNSLLSAKQQGKNARVKGFSWERLERTLGVALHAAFAHAIRDALAELPARKIAAEANERILLLASLGPDIFLSIRSADQEDANPHELPPAAESLLQPVYQTALDLGSRPWQLLRVCCREVFADGARLAALRPLALARTMRQLVLEHLTAVEEPASAADQTLAKCLASDSALLLLLREGTARLAVQQELEQRCQGGRTMQKIMPQTRRLIVFLAQAAKCLESPGPDERESVWLQELIERFILRRLDEYAATHLAEALSRVRDGRHELSRPEIIKRYEAGTLYRLGDDEQPLLRVRQQVRQAQLFVDLKGYTRRTAAIKELSMAEFMRQEFYLPILEAAKKLRAGPALLPRENDIQLVNLMGDAVAFAGNVVAMVGLAREIQTIFESYRRKLQQRAPQADRDKLHALGKHIEQQRAGILAEMEKLSQQMRAIQEEVFRRGSLPEPELRKLVPGQTAAEKKQRLLDLACCPLLEQIRQLEGRMAVLRQEDRILADALAEESRLVLGAEMEAGLFISFGTAAEAVELQDDTWGRQVVFIGERINEAARGTARNELVRCRVQEMLEKAAAECANPRLEIPFRVWIEPTRTPALSGESCQMWRRALERGDAELLERFLEKLRGDIRAEFSRAAGDAANEGFATDIYNVGEAISGPALDAYLRETASSHFFFRRVVKVEELHPEIRRRFFFPESVLSLVLGKPLTGDEQSEIFRYVGQVAFRGFEHSVPLAVYEIMRPESPLVALLFRYHLPEWVADGTASKGNKLEGLN